MSTLKNMAMVLIVVTLSGCQVIHHPPSMQESLMPNPIADGSREDGEEKTNTHLTILNYTGNTMIKDRCGNTTNYGGLAHCIEDLASTLREKQAACEQWVPPVTPRNEPKDDNAKKAGPGDVCGDGNVGKEAQWYERLAKRFRQCQKGMADPCKKLINQYNATKEQKEPSSHTDERSQINQMQKQTSNQDEKSQINQMQKQKQRGVKDEDEDEDN